MSRILLKEKRRAPSSPLKGYADTNVNSNENCMKFKKLFAIVLFLFLILCLTSCAPAGVTEHVYGFFGGVWHGFIFSFSLIGQLFGSDIGLFAETNSGVPYYVGCVIGVLVIGVISFGKL